MHVLLGGFLDIGGDCVIVDNYCQLLLLILMILLLILLIAIYIQHVGCGSNREGALDICIVFV